MSEVTRILSQIESGDPSAACLQQIVAPSHSFRRAMFATPNLILSRWVTGTRMVPRDAFVGGSVDGRVIIDTATPATCGFGIMGYHQQTAQHACHGQGALAEPFQKR